MYTCRYIESLYNKLLCYHIDRLDLLLQFIFCQQNVNKGATIQLLGGGERFLMRQIITSTSYLQTFMSFTLSLRQHINFTLF